MSFPDAVRTVLSKYVDFSGRARRSEFWWFILAYFIALIVASVIDGVVFGTFVLYYVVILGLLLPYLAVGARRLHDTGRSGWWLLIGLVPLAGAIVLIVFTVQDSQPAPNQYGAPPKQAFV